MCSIWLKEGKLFLHYFFWKLHFFSTQQNSIINDIKQIESLTIIGKYTANAALPHLLHPSSLFLLSNTSHSRAQEIMTVTSGNLSYNTENYSKNTGWSGYTVNGKFWILVFTNIILYIKWLHLHCGSLNQ